MMRSRRDVQRCVLCKVGNLIRSDQEIAFKQLTNKGYVFCRLTIPMDVCEYCGWKTSDADAEAIIAEAVRQEYDRKR
jgi:hypothetical protein